MKKLYKILAGFCALVGLIIAMSNVAMTFPAYIFFKVISQPLTFPFLLMMLLGMGTGFFLAMAMMSGKSDQPSDFGGDDEF